MMMIIKLIWPWWPKLISLQPRWRSLVAEPPWWHISIVKYIIRDWFQLTLKTLRWVILLYCVRTGYMMAFSYVVSIWILSDDIKLNGRCQLWIYYFFLRAFSWFLDKVNWWISLNTTLSHNHEALTTRMRSKHWFISSDIRLSNLNNHYKISSDVVKMDDTKMLSNSQITRAMSLAWITWVLDGSETWGIRISLSCQSKSILRHQSIYMTCNHKLRPINHVLLHHFIFDRNFKAYKEKAPQSEIHNPLPGQ